MYVHVHVLNLYQYSYPNHFNNIYSQQKREAAKAKKDKEKGL